jgi:beta-glucanase (GH16 family)
MVMGLAHSAPVAHQATQNSKLPAKTLSLLDLGTGFENHLRPNSNQVTFSVSKDAAKPGLDVMVSPGKEGFPGLNIKPPLASWNLSPFGHIEAKIVNTGKKPLTLALRVDNAGDWQNNPWNTESIQLDPGATDTISTMFGYSYGHKRGFPLNSSAVVNILFFAVKVEEPESFRIESLVAAGPAGEKPPAPPEDFRLAPASGVMFGPATPLDLATQITATNVQPLLVGNDKEPAIRIEYPASKADQSTLIKLPFGCWDLHAFPQVQVSVRNMGAGSFTPKVKLYSRGGNSDWVAASKPLAPRQSVVLAIPFKGTVPSVVGVAGTGSSITSDAISGVEIQLDSPDTNRVLYVDAVQGNVPLATALPDWVGQRPPVPGDWVKTLDENFDGSALDASLWSVYGENYYDKVTHWSKNEVLVGGGVVRLRYEKKSGYQNDDPKRVKTEYAAGYLQTYDKWAQRYGYFEARMKLPKAPGLWPAFWMMPERGRSSPPDGRNSTENGGMEFDIMEHLTRWGSFRYNISMHYDGYGITHKSVGSDKIYIQPDKDGFITCGLLWTPASAIFYCNGIEVLRWENARVANVPCSFLFTLPSGGWDNSPLEDTQLPDEFVIDYVRVWQRKDLASPADGKIPSVSGSKG